MAPTTDTDDGGPAEPMDWIEYQQNEIDTAAEAVGDRLEAVASDYNHGLLSGAYIQERQNERLEAYLEGYTDALEYASQEIDGIDNLVQYAIDHAADTEEADTE